LEDVHQAGGQIPDGAVSIGAGSSYESPYERSTHAALQLGVNNRPTDIQVHARWVRMVKDIRVCDSAWIKD
jgi:hypothetical protein